MTAHSLTWDKSRPDLMFPGSGLLQESDGTKCLGALGFRPGQTGCEIWHESTDESADWSSLIDRVTAQARKAKYRSATLDDSSQLPAELVDALHKAGFAGEPLFRDLCCDSADDLQPYLDWKGRIVQLAQGKGSDAINSKLFEIVASKFPSEGRYSEQEVNSILKDLHLYNDHSALRRELVDRGYIARTRDCREYWKVEAKEN